MSSASAREFSPRLRADLEWSHHGDQARWIAHDPVAMQFFSFSELERSATRLMMGRLSFSEIVAQLRQSYPALAIDATWVSSLLSRLQMHHLLQPRTRADTLRIAQAQARRQMPGWVQQLLSPIAIRVPLFNPTPLLNVLSPLAHVLFQPLLLLAWLVVGCVLGLCVLREVLTTGLAASINWSILRGDGWWLLLVSYLVAKSLHELGHGLACVRYRVQCRELGILFLCLAPCLYCDTSDSWKLPSKWQRATIAGAGMIVEWILATMAAGVWLITQDGSLHSVAASMMVVCSVGTLLVNSNPFLKYDGYYLLSDLWGVPNLSEQGSDALRALAASALSGRPLERWHTDAPIALLATYALVATVYRTFILGAILWISWKVLVPLGLGLIAVLLTASLLFGLLLGYARSMRRLWREVLLAESIRVGRWIVFFTLCLLAAALVFTVPLPHVVRVRGVSDYQDKQPLFVNQTAELIYAAPVNRRLPAGELLLEFAAPESQYELLELRGQIATLEQTLQQLRLRSTLDPSSAYLIPTKTEELQQLHARERVLLREIASLTHTAPHDGYLLAGTHVVRPSLTAPRDARFRHNPLDPNLIGSTCDRGTLVGWFSRREHRILTLIVPEQEIKRLVVGMTATIGWDANIAHLGRGKVVRIAPEPILETPPELVGDATLLSERNAQGVFLPSKPHYEVTVDVELNSSDLLPLRGSLATAQFALPAQTIWQRLVEAVRNNLKPLS
ncbi:MAG: hypothetical protein IT422_24735 [Pirellulaceae bacterium]|nr:hypothetical protein [Pirellulaceae bacterium]